MPLEIIIPIAAAFILLILFTWVINVFKVTFKTVLILVAIFVLLQIMFGVTSQDIIQEMLSIVERIKQLVDQGLG